jgi:hypothetical protein
LSSLEYVSASKRDFTNEIAYAPGLREAAKMGVTGVAKAGKDVGEKRHHMNVKMKMHTHMSHLPKARFTRWRERR